jgi:uncharacterized phage infection (PIP) family protein YhgE
MEVFAAMNDAQKSALQSIGSELGIPNLVDIVTETGEQRTKELEEQGTRYKAQADTPPIVAEPVAEAAAVTEPLAEQPTEPVVEAAPAEVKAADEEPPAEEPGEQASKAILQLAEHIAANLHIADVVAAVEQLQSSLKAVADAQKAQSDRLNKLEDIGTDALSPLIPLPRAAFHRAALMGPQPSEKHLATAAPVLPDAIVEMAKHIPVS